VFAARSSNCVAKMKSVARKSKSQIIFPSIAQKRNYESTLQVRPRPAGHMRPTKQASLKATIQVVEYIKNMFKKQKKISPFS
jgi:hypothetical protein